MAALKNYKISTNLYTLQKFKTFEPGLTSNHELEISFESLDCPNIISTNNTQNLSILSHSSPDINRKVDQFFKTLDQKPSSSLTEDQSFISPLTPNFKSKGRKKSFESTHKINKAFRSTLNLTNNTLKRKISFKNSSYWFGFLRLSNRFFIKL